MREELKTSFVTIAAMLSKQTGRKYTAGDIETLVYGWLRHPKFRYLSRETLRLRVNRDGYRWLKEDEIASLFIYAGYPLT